MLVDLVLGLIVLGFLLWALQLVPMDGTVKQLVRGIVILLIVFWVVSLLFGFRAPFVSWPIGRR